MLFSVHTINENSIVRYQNMWNYYELKADHETIKDEKLELN